MKYRVEAKLLITAFGAYPRNSIIESDGPEAAAMLKDGNITPAAADAAVSAPLPYRHDTIDELTTAVLVSEQEERAAWLSTLSPFKRELTSALDELIRLGLVATKDKAHAAQVLGL